MKTLATLPPGRGESQKMQKRINVFLPDDWMERVRVVARAKGISEGGAGRYLIAHGLDWWEALSRDQRETV